MSRRRRKDQAEAPGQDSFLDVVANLVGILIILVVVVGAGTKTAAVAVAKQALLETPQPLDDGGSERDVAKAQETGVAIEHSIHELEAKIAREKRAMAARDMERQQVQLLVTVAENRLQEHRNSLGGVEQVKYDLAQELTQAKGVLEHLERAKTATTDAGSPAVLEHYPTPMAKTVFGREVHFRLLGGRITYIPWDELVDRLKADAPNKVQRLRDQARVEEVLAPFGGWVLKYALRRNDLTVPTRSGQAAPRAQIELDRFVLIPVQEPMGEPLGPALANRNSDLRAVLSGLSPRQTTLTVWVYPDSFNEFRQFKAEMFKAGFLTAARPLPEGLPIGGSPDGARSSAE